MWKGPYQISEKANNTLFSTQEYQFTTQREKSIKFYTLKPKRLRRKKEKDQLYFQKDQARSLAT